MANRAAEAAEPLEQALRLWAPERPWHVLVQLAVAYAWANDEECSLAYEAEAAQAIEALDPEEERACSCACFVVTSSLLNLCCESRCL